MNFMLLDYVTASVFDQNPRSDAMQTSCSEPPASPSKFVDASGMDVPTTTGRP